VVIVVKQLPLEQTVKKVKMTLIKSISGIRGTLENIPGESLSDYDIKQFTLAYHQEIISRYDNQVVVIGRDARKSGERIAEIVSSILIIVFFTLDSSPEFSDLFSEMIHSLP